MYLESMEQLEESLEAYSKIKEKLQRERSPEIFDEKKFMERYLISVDETNFNQYQKETLNSMLDDLSCSTSYFLKLFELYLEERIEHLKLKKSFLKWVTGSYVLYGCLTGDFKKITTNPELFQIFRKIINDPEKLKFFEEKIKTESV